MEKLWVCFLVTALPSQWPCYHGPPCDQLTAITFGLHFQLCSWRWLFDADIGPLFCCKLVKELLLLDGASIFCFSVVCALPSLFGFGWYDCDQRVEQIFCSLSAFVVSW